MVVRPDEGIAIGRDLAGGNRFDGGIGNFQDRWTLLQSCLDVLSVDFRHLDGLTQLNVRFTGCNRFGFDDSVSFQDRLRAAPLTGTTFNVALWAGAFGKPIRRTGSSNDTITRPFR